MTMMTTRTTATQSEPALFISVGDKREHFVKVVVAFVTLLFW